MRITTLKIIFTFHTYPMSVLKEVFCIDLPPQQYNINFMTLQFTLTKVTWCAMSASFLCLVYSMELDSCRKSWWMWNIFMWHFIQTLFQTLYFMSCFIGSILYVLFWLVTCKTGFVAYMKCLLTASPSVLRTTNFQGHKGTTVILKNGETHFVVFR